MENILMENVIWKFVKPLKNKLSVEEFMKKNKIHLPDELIKCIIKNNGGRPSVFLFDTDKRTEYVFQSLFSYNHGDKSNIYDIYPIFESTTWFPIGLETAGNIICFDTKNNRYVLWNHESGNIEIIKQ